MHSQRRYSLARQIHGKVVGRKQFYSPRGMLKVSSSLEDADSSDIRDGSEAHEAEKNPSEAFTSALESVSASMIRTGRTNLLLQSESLEGWRRIDKR
jgi:hypothetical protein